MVYHTFMQFPHDVPVVFPPETTVLGLGLISQGYQFTSLLERGPSSFLGVVPISKAKSGGRWLPMKADHVCTRCGPQQL